MAHIAFKVGKKEIASVELTESMVVGRSPDCRVTVRDQLLSRRHLQFEPTDHGWAARDLGSANGTRVDGELITRHELSDGDLIELGHITIIYLQDSLAAPEATDEAKQIVIDQTAFAHAQTNSRPPSTATPPVPTPSTLSSSMTAVHYTPPEVVERAKRWKEAAIAQQSTRMQPPTLSERLNKMPRGLALSAVALTGLALFCAAFFLTSMLTR